MKKCVISMLLTSVLMMSVLVGCGGDVGESSTPVETQSDAEESMGSASVAETYREMAQSLLDDEDYDAAISILQKGIDATGDAGLADLLKEALALQMSAEPTATLELVDTPAPETSHPSTSTEVPGFSDIKGVWQDEENSGVVMTIDYSTNINGETNPHIWYDVGPGLEGTLYSEDGGETFTGPLFVGDASQPSLFINIYRYKYWLEVTFSDDSGDSYAKFVPAG